MKYVSIALIVVVLLALPISSVLVAGTNVQQLTNYSGQQSYPQSGVIPTFSITSVETDETVSIQTYNFPADDTFVVTMGAFGTQGIGGIEVDSTESGSGGTFTASYSIPDSLQGSYRIAIRLESPSSGYYSYNWFYNDSAAVPEPIYQPPAAGGPYPTQGDSSSWISILSVVEDESVTIEMHNLVPNDVVQIFMHYIGTEGVGGKYVSTLVTDEGGTRKRILQIPDLYHGEYQIAIRVESNISDYVAHNWFYNDTTAAPSLPYYPPAAGAPVYDTSSLISILSVEPNESVTINMHGLVPNDVVQIFIHYMGTKGVGGKYVSTLVTDEGGTRKRILQIPDLYDGEYQLAIRVESNISNYVAYGWFYNDTAGIPIAQPPATYVPYPVPGYTYSSISIINVIPDEKVTIQMNNLPPQDVLQIHMNYYGTQGLEGKYVGTVVTDEGGSMRRTIKIPNLFHGESRIDIRVDSNISGYAAWNWFYNDYTVSYYSAPYPSSTASYTTSSYSGFSDYPTTTILSGVSGESVTLQGHNFPANDTFEVRMNVFGTKGINGILVETMNTGEGGEFTATFDIPEELQDEARIAIRLESPTSGYYAFDWFNN